MVVAAIHPPRYSSRSTSEKPHCFAIRLKYVLGMLLGRNVTQHASDSSTMGSVAKLDAVFMLACDALFVETALEQCKVPNNVFASEEHTWTLTLSLACIIAFS
jgi:hypothetical protein